MCYITPVLSEILHPPSNHSQPEADVSPQVDLHAALADMLGLPGGTPHGRLHYYVDDMPWTGDVFDADANLAKSGDIIRPLSASSAIPILVSTIPNLGNLPANAVTAAVIVGIPLLCNRWWRSSRYDRYAESFREAQNVADNTARVDVYRIPIEEHGKDRPPYGVALRYYGATEQPGETPEQHAAATFTSLKTALGVAQKNNVTSFLLSEDLARQLTDDQLPVQDMTNTLCQKGFLKDKEATLNDPVVDMPPAYWLQKAQELESSSGDHKVAALVSMLRSVQGMQHIVESYDAYRVAVEAKEATRSLHYYTQFWSAITRGFTRELAESDVALGEDSRQKAAIQLLPTILQNGCIGWKMPYSPHIEKIATIEQALKLDYKAPADVIRNPHTNPMLAKKLALTLMMQLGRGIKHPLLEALPPVPGARSQALLTPDFRPRLQQAYFGRDDYLRGAYDDKEQQEYLHNVCTLKKHIDKRTNWKRIGVLAAGLALAGAGTTLLFYQHEGAKALAEEEVAAVYGLNPVTAEIGEERLDQRAREISSYAALWGVVLDVGKPMRQLIGIEDGPQIPRNYKFAPPTGNWRLNPVNMSADGYWAAGTSHAVKVLGNGELTWLPSTEDNNDVTVYRLPTSVPKDNSTYIEVNRSYDNLHVTKEQELLLKVPVLLGTKPVAANIDGKVADLYFLDDDTFGIALPKNAPVGNVQYWVAPDKDFPGPKATAKVKALNANDQEINIDVDLEWERVIPGFTNLSYDQQLAAVGKHLRESTKYRVMPGFLPLDKERATPHGYTAAALEKNEAGCEAASSLLAMKAGTGDGNINGQYPLINVVSGYGNRTKNSNLQSLNTHELHQWNVDATGKQIDVVPANGATPEDRAFLNAEPDSLPEGPASIPWSLLALAALASGTYLAREPIVKAIKRTPRATAKLVRKIDDAIDAKRLEQVRQNPQHAHMAASVVETVLYSNVQNDEAIRAASWRARAGSLLNPDDALLRLASIGDYGFSEHGHMPSKAQITAIGKTLRQRLAQTDDDETREILKRTINAVKQAPRLRKQALRSRRPYQVR